MGVSDQHEVGLHAVEARLPSFRIARHVLVEGIPRCGVDEQEALAAEGEHARRRLVGEESPVGGAEGVEGRLAGDHREVAEAAGAEELDVLDDAVVVIPADAVVGVAPHPIDARGRLGAVFHGVAEAQANVVRFGNRVEGRAIGVNIGDDQDPHRASPILILERGESRDYAERGNFGFGIADFGLEEGNPPLESE